MVAALKLKLLPQELQAITTRSTSNAQAYKYYLRGRARLSVSWGTREYLSAARRLFAKAAKTDPGYARAYAGIADCDAFLWVNGDLDVSYEQMIANSSRALELAPNLAEAHASRGVAFYVSGHPREAMAAFDRAMALDSGLFEAHYFYGFCSREIGDPYNSVLHFERAAEIQPKNYQPLTLLSELYLVIGDPARSIAAARGCLARIVEAFGPEPEIAEVLAMGAATLVYLNDYERAERWAERAVQYRSGFLHGPLQRRLLARRHRQAGQGPGVSRGRLLAHAARPRLAARQRAPGFPAQFPAPAGGLPGSDEAARGQRRGGRLAAFSATPTLPSPQRSDPRRRSRRVNQPAKQIQLVRFSRREDLRRHRTNGLARPSRARGREK